MGHAPDAARAANRRGVLAMAAAMAAFAFSDALLKYASASLPTSQLIFVRGVFASALLLAAVGWMGAMPRLSAVLDRWVVTRSLLEALTAALFITAIVHMPLASVTSINMALPLVVTLGAALFLGERVGHARWTAILLGFAGVLLVVQPSGSGFNAYSLFALGGTVFAALRDFGTRRIDREIPSIVVTFATAVVVTLSAALWGLPQAWQPLTWPLVAALAGAGVFSSLALALLTLSTRTGDVSLIAPFRYTRLLFALGLGYALWGEVPNLLAMSGIVLITAAGLFMLWLSRR